jgi:hypothetical protein
MKKNQRRKRNPLPSIKQDFSHLKFWFKGERISKAEHDKLGWDVIHENNNEIRRAA